MSKFCGKCGSELNENGLCSNCDSAKITAEKEKQVKVAECQRKVTVINETANIKINNSKQFKATKDTVLSNNYNQDNTYPKELTKKDKKVKEKAEKAASKVKCKASKKADKIIAKANEKAAQKSDKSAARIKSKALKKVEINTKKYDIKANKKAEKVEKKASRPIGQKIKWFVIKMFAILLAILTLFSAVSGVLVYYKIADIPIVSDVMNAFGINSDDDNEQFKSLEGKFTDVSINDESSAVEAAKDAAKQMGLNNAADELTSLNTSTVDGSTYYRLQENYKGIPVYGRTMVVIADENGNAQGITSNATDIPDNISLTPSVTQEQVNDSIKKYIDSEIDGDDATGLSVENLVADKLAIYNLDDMNSAALVYVLSVDTETGSYNILVNAISGEVLSVVNNIITESVKCYNSDGSKQFTGSYNATEKRYEMYDESRNIYVFSLEKTNSNKANCTKTYITSDDEYFGNIDAEKKLEQDKAVNYINTISKVRDFYINEFDDYADDILVCLYNDSYYNGNNAYAKDSVSNEKKSVIPNGTKIGIISLGYTKSVETVDLVAHEYMHRVESNKSGMIYENESGAIMEGYSDIFGEIVEDYLDDEEFNGSCDWIHNGFRSIKKPSDNGYPTKVSDKNNSGEDYVHGYATVISHCAYQMFTGLDGNNEKINTDTLAKLWYRTMLALPANCSFSNLYYNMWLTARIMELSEGQLSCINAAFLEAGITLEESLEECSLETKLSVLDKTGNSYDNYTIDISGEKKCGLFGAFSENYKNKIVVDNTNPVDLNLPEGTYSITVSDNFASNNIYDKIITVKKNSKNNQLKIPTDFGFDYTVRSGVNINVYDVNKVKYDDYTIKIDGTADDKNSYSDSKTISDTYGYQVNLQNGQYTVTLTDNKDNSKTKTFTVRVKDSAFKRDINVETEFGKKYGEFDKSKVPSDAVEYNGHYYYVYEAKKGKTDWNKAKENCELNDGYLATITSEEENKFLFALINKFGYKNAYFGLHDEGSNDWKWDNGETFYYSNWASGEPSSSFEDYGMYYYKYTEQWNDGDFSLSDEDGKTGYICEWGEYSVENSEIPVTTPTHITSSERDIVLVLDTSGSMSGTPLDETKKAATSFVDTILEEDASIGIVSYDNVAEMKSDFSNSENYLDSVISELRADGSTNMEAGLRTADQMLSQSSAKKKIIVLMSDGEPNEGLTDDALVSYADELKEKGTYIYTLGFFESVNEKTVPQTLMEKIASDGCHYEVSDADSLVFFFGDIADQINGQRYIYVRIACPVDVSVTSNGETLDSSQIGLNTRTSFGSLTFEESDTQEVDSILAQESSSEESEDDKVKILRLKEGEDYNINIAGTGKGKMNYSIGFMDENGEYADFRRFKNIKITKNTQINTVANVSDESILNVDEDGDGKYDIIYKAEANGYGKIVDYSYVIYIVIGAVSVITLFVIVLIIRSKIKKRKLSKIK